MEAESKLRLADVFVSITDPRQAGKVAHDLVELLVVAVNAVLVGADTFVEIELWARERIDWLSRYLRLENGIPSHDTFGRLFGLIDPDEFETAFRRWASAVVPTLGGDTVVAIDGKTSRRTGRVDTTPLHLVSAFELPSVFRLPKGGFHATRFFRCCSLIQFFRNCAGDL